MLKRLFTFLMIAAILCVSAGCIAETAEEAPAIRLVRDGLPGAGSVVRFSVADAEGNPVSGDMEWSVKAKFAGIKIDQEGNLTIPKSIKPGTEITVRCRVLGAEGEMEAEYPMRSLIAMPEGMNAAIALMKQYPLPDALQTISTEGSDWLPEGAIPQLTGIREVTLEDGELYIVTEKDVANIYVGEISKSGGMPVQDYNSQGDYTLRTAHEARFRVQDLKRNKVIVSVNEYAVVCGQRQLVSGTYTLKTNPVRLEPEATSFSIDLDLQNYPPYTSAVARYCMLQCEVYPDGRALRAGYHFDGDACSFQIEGNFDKKTGKMTRCRLFRWCFGNGAELDAEVELDGDGKIRSVSMQCPGVFIYTLTNGKNDSNIRKLAKSAYFKADLDAEGVEVWMIDVLENEEWITKYFVCDEPLFTRLEDGSLRINTEIRDVNGYGFPYLYLSEIMEPELFSLPAGMQ